MKRIQKALAGSLALAMAIHFTAPLFAPEREREVATSHITQKSSYLQSQDVLSSSESGYGDYLPVSGSTGAMVPYFLTEETVTAGVDVIPTLLVNESSSEAVFMVSAVEPEGDFSITPNTSILLVDDTTEITVESDIVLTDFRWSSSDDSVALVSSSGMVTAVGVGDVIITATAYSVAADTYLLTLDGTTTGDTYVVTADCSISVIATTTIPESALTWNLNGENFVSGKEIVYSGSAQAPELMIDSTLFPMAADVELEVVYVDLATGSPSSVKPTDVGDYRVDVTPVGSDYAFASGTASMEFSIQKASISIYLNHITMSKGAVASIPVTVSGLDTSLVTPYLIWESEDTTVATVSYGQVTGVGAGTTVVRAKTNSDNIYTVAASCNISVIYNTTLPDSDSSLDGSGSTGTGGETPLTTAYTIKITGTGARGVSLSPSTASAGDKVLISLAAGLTIGDVTITTANGTVVEIIKSAFGDYYYFIHPESAVTVSVTGQVTGGTTTTPTIPTTPSSGYSDVLYGDWYYDAVNYVAKEGLMTGTGNGMFSPDMTTTRGMIAQVLYSLAGKPWAGSSSFTDVSAGAYYYSAVAWANNNGIADGVGGGNFDPEGNMTREQLVVMLYGYEKKYGEGGLGDDWDYSMSYHDSGSISTWALEATAWATMHGLVSGTTTGAFEPQATATRAQLAVILQNFVSMY